MVQKSTLRPSNEENRFVNDSSNNVAVNTVSEINNGPSNPVPVEIVNGTIGEAVLIYNEVSSAPASTSTTILTYTVPAGEILKVGKIEVSGKNIAEYSVILDGVTQKKKRTYWGTFDTEFSFEDFEAGEDQVLTVVVNNFRSSTADFNVTLEGSK